MSDDKSIMDDTQIGKPMPWYVILSVVIFLGGGILFGLVVTEREKRQEHPEAMPTLGEQMKATEKFMAGIPKEEPEIVFDKDGAKVYKVTVPGQGVIYVATTYQGVALTR